MKKEDVTRSPFFYVGDKYKLLPQILPLFPENINRYFEVFVGGGSVFLNTQAKNVFINDIDKNIIDIHSFLISNCGREDAFLTSLNKSIAQYGLTNSSQGYVVDKKIKETHPKTYFSHINRQSYDALKTKYNTDVKKNIQDLYILMIFGFNRMLRFNRKGEFNIPAGNVDFNSNVVKALLGYFSKAKDRNITLSNLHYEDFLASQVFVKDDFVYLDPPYLITGSEYNKLWNDQDDERLYKILDGLDKKGVKFALSNVIVYGDKHNVILERWAEKYNVHVISSNYINYFDNGKKNIQEVLVTNYG
jgi:DNA adenine methylase